MSTKLVDKPIAPFRRHSLSKSCILPSSSSFAVRCIESSPMTHRRRTLCPTSGATLIVRSFLIRLRNSSKVSQFHSTPSWNALMGISSIWLNMPTSFIRCSALSGASDSEQLPGTMVVMPCSMAGLARPSHSSCASKCVCGSMNPGETILPAASISWEAGSEMLPLAAIFPSLTPTSPMYPGMPVPSTIVPLRMMRSNMIFAPDCY